VKPRRGTKSSLAGLPLRPAFFLRGARYASDRRPARASGASSALCIFGHDIRAESAPYDRAGTGSFGTLVSTLRWCTAPVQQGFANHPALRTTRRGGLLSTFRRGVLIGYRPDLAASRFVISPTVARTQTPRHSHVSTSSPLTSARLAAHWVPIPLAEMVADRPTQSLSLGCPPSYSQPQHRYQAYCYSREVRTTYAEGSIYQCGPSGTRSPPVDSVRSTARFLGAARRVHLSRAGKMILHPNLRAVLNKDRPARSIDSVADTVGCHK